MGGIKSFCGIAVADPEGAQQAPPSKFWSTKILFIKFCIRILQNKPQIAWESIIFIKP